MEIKPKIIFSNLFTKYLMILRFLAAFSLFAVVLSIGAAPAKERLTYQAVVEKSQPTVFTEKWQKNINLKLTPDPHTKNFIKEIKTLPKEDRIRYINIAVNRYVTYVGEGKEDYWQSANETLQLGTGDCEDYAILKYHLLLKVGFSKKDLFMVLGWHDKTGHAQLVARLENKYHVLDNNSNLTEPLEKFRPMQVLTDTGTWKYK